MGFSHIPLETNGKQDQPACTESKQSLYSKVLTKKPQTQHISNALAVVILLSS